jgi:PIN domain nuclease of toxin-antitoxin system
MATSSRRTTKPGVTWTDLPWSHRVWRPDDDDGVEGPVLLDTHAWLWTLDGDLAKMSPAVEPLLQHRAVDASIYVCDISFWEVALKAKIGKLKLSMDVMVWLRRAERAPSIRYLPLDREILLLSTQFGSEMPGDPADRMLAAAAQLHTMSLVTVDPGIIDYAREHRTFSVCDVRA